jgi:tetratricopeptide (TPR) repeat protein
VQNVAHGSLLRGARQQLHVQIAEALETHSPELMDSQPELFAQHYAEAGLVEKSVACWGKAGRRSAARSALAEAAKQFQKALDQLALLPDDIERRRQELEYYSALGTVLQAVKGYPAPETGQAHARARVLWEQLGSPSEFLQIPYAQSVYHAIRGEFDLAQGLAEDLLRLSRQRNDAAGLVLAHQCIGGNLMFVGSFCAIPIASRRDARALRSGLSRLAGPSGRATPLAVAQAHLGTSFSVSGFRTRHWHVVTQPSLRLGGWLTRRLSCEPRVWRQTAFARRGQRSHGRANKAGDCGPTEQDFPVWRAQGTISRGWVKVKDGDVAEGISLLRSGSAAYRATGATTWMPHYIALLARACEIAGQIEESSIL